MTFESPSISRCGSAPLGRKVRQPLDHVAVGRWVERRLLKHRWSSPQLTLVDTSVAKEVASRFTQLLQLESSEAQCCGFCFRDDVMVVKPPSKSRVSGDLSVSDAEIGIGGVVSEAVFSRATLN